MRFLADESVERLIVARLRQDGHLVQHISEIAPGIPDDEVLNRANQAGVTLITEDKDFGDLIYRQGFATVGVVLVHLAGLSSAAKAIIVAGAVSRYSNQLEYAFTVIRANAIRIRRRKRGNSNGTTA